MNLKVHYSSSKGNLCEIQDHDAGRLLLDCGGSYKMVMRALGDLHDIHGCIISHYHADHCKAFPKLVDLFGLDMYASNHTLTVLPLVGRSDKVHIVSDKPFSVGDYNITPFKTHHDVDGSIGCIIEYDGKHILWATDTSHITESWDIPFQAIALECSWDRDLVDAGLADGSMNDFYANRLRTTHMERSNTMKYLKDCCDLSMCREIHLLHMSGHMDKEKVRAEFEAKLTVPTFAK